MILPMWVRALGFATVFVVCLWLGRLTAPTVILEPSPAPTVTVQPRPLHAELYAPDGDKIRVNCTHIHVICEGRKP